MRYLTLIPVFLILTNCASKNDVAINESYERSVKNHAVQQTIQVGNKARSIQEAMVYDCNDGTEACGVAKAMSSMMAAQYISQISPQEYKGVRPVTGVDVQKDMAGFTGRLVTGAMTVGIVREVSRNQPTTTYNNDGDVKGSGNRSETHATAIGDENSGLSSDSAMDSQNDEATDNSVNDPAE